jgi:glycerophosphoryl diester phosphodiesterase
MPTSQRLAAAWVAAVALAACTSEAAAPPAACPASPFRSVPPVVIAHAGGEGLGPANTILAMQRSMAAGADLLDADLWMTSDGVVVARHDRDLATTTDGQGNIDDRTWADLQVLDTRARWTGEAIRQPVRIPSLEQILLAFPDVRISLEIKQSEPSMAAALCETLVRTGSVERVYLSANDDSAVYEAQRRCPESTVITTTYRDVGAMREAKETNGAWCAPAPIGQPPYAEGRFGVDDVRWSHDHGMAIYTWTVDDPDTLRELALAGVDGVYTRRPDIARQVFDEVAAAGSPSTSP